MVMQQPFRFGVVAAQARSGDEWVTTAQRAETLGYSTFLIPDTLGPTLAPMPALAAVAAATTTIRTGTYVLANDVRNPVHVARESATLDFLSGGRFELGLGAGRPDAADDCRKLGIPFSSGAERVERLSEALSIIKAVLGGERVNATGPYYAMVGADSFPRPVQQPRPPLLVAGSGRRLLSLAAREADIVALGVRPDESQAVLAEKIDWVRQAAESRFAQLELNMNLVAVLPAGQEPPAPHPYFRLDIAELVRSGSPFVLSGTVEQMCDQLRERREAFHVSYLTAPVDLMEVLAPVVERLAGQ